MSDANLGLLCNVCGKIFKSRDALDFHIMYTKLPGHDVLQQVIVCLFKGQLISKRFFCFFNSPKK